MKKGQPRPVVQRVENLAEKRRNSILKKCHPALFELAPLWKESIIKFHALGSSAPKELLTELERKFEKRLQEIQQKYSGPHPPAPNTFAAQVIFRNEENMSDGDGIADWIHFGRHKIPLKGDVERRQNKDWNSTRECSALSTIWNSSVAGSPFAHSRATWNTRACSRAFGVSE
jgi:hypothetical protein